MDLRELYQEIIMDHNRNPRNHFIMEDATTSAQGFNPLCGDKLTLFLKIKDNHLVDISFKGCGCAISQASASLMTEALKDKSTNEAHAIFQAFHEMMTATTPKDVLSEFTKLKVLQGVREFPIRVKCATLAWHTLDKALSHDDDIVTTE